MLRSLKGQGAACGSSLQPSDKKTENHRGDEGLALATQATPKGAANPAAMIIMFNKNFDGGKE